MIDLWLRIWQACKSGISFGIADLKTPDLKQKFVSDAESQVTEFESQYLDGFITQGENIIKSLMCGLAVQI
ncbi:MAG: hypothetical protein CM15mP117_14800 [Alphaproteobacteria bacterium]|nr:MAG: hypothetical protein CM15mP117_14800 [Alphaproteobacteria bacterium]